jgi:mono/diheme cytochrome c family protein
MQRLPYGIERGDYRGQNKLGSVAQKRYNPGMDSPRKRKLSIPAVAGLIVISAGVYALQAQAPGSVWDGAYTQAQAQRGEAKYQQQCSVCHGDALEGDAQTERGKQLNRVLPPLSGDVFKGNWNGRPLSDLFDKVSRTMPRDDPGKVSHTDTADIIAFMLKFNGFPAGKAELPPDPSLLTETLFESVKPKK